MLLRVGGHPGAGVLDLDAQRAAHRVRAQHDAAFERVLHSVLAEVAQHLLEQVTVHRRREPRYALDLERHAVGGTQIGRNLIEQWRQLDRLTSRTFLARMRAGERQQRACEPPEPR